MRSEPLAPTAATPRDPTEARSAVKVHAHLTALLGLLAEADLSVVEDEALERQLAAFRQACLDGLEPAAR